MPANKWGGDRGPGSSSGEMKEVQSRTLIQQQRQLHEEQGGEPHWREEQTWLEFAPTLSLLTVQVLKAGQVTSFEALKAGKVAG